MESQCIPYKTKHFCDILRNITWLPAAKRDFFFFYKKQNTNIQGFLKSWTCNFYVTCLAKVTIHINLLTRVVEGGEKINRTEISEKKVVSG